MSLGKGTEATIDINPKRRKMHALPIEAGNREGLAVGYKMECGFCCRRQMRTTTGSSFHAILQCNLHHEC